jgi:hypothetical protein
MTSVATPIRRDAPQLVPRRAMLHPWIDTLCVGAASIGFIVAWAVFDFDVSSANALSRVYFINYLINAPHFMASYRLLYGSPDKRRRYPGVAWWVPALLAAWAVIGLVVYRENPVWTEALFGAAAVSLSWHYTGQTWGMMASFAYVNGFHFTPGERRLVRANLWALTGFHVVWAVVVMRKIFAAPGDGVPLLSDAQAMALYRASWAIAAASAVLGVAGLVLWSQRLRRLPPVRVWVPWVATHLWYVLLGREPAALFWVQNAHALQYLVFPMRAELNRTAATAPATGARPPALRLLRYYGFVLALGLAVLWLLPWLARTQRGFVGLAGLPVELTIVSFVNLHHYFIDGVVWKIRDPQVRRDLFAHLTPAQA